MEDPLHGELSFNAATYLVPFHPQIHFEILFCFRTKVSKMASDLILHGL
jgi:hypothetical protein